MFENMDQVLDYIREQPQYNDISINYSTLSDYYDAVIPLEEWGIRDAEDFFPYASNNESNWVGFYSSRSSLKSKFRLTPVPHMTEIFLEENSGD